MAFLTFAGFFFYKLLSPEYDGDTSKRALKYFLLSPTIFFAMLPMSEGLFLFLCALFLYLLKKEKLLFASLIGFLAAFTRSTGVILVVPFVVHTFCGRKNDGKFNFLLWIKNSLPAIVIALGTLLYLLINYLLFGNPLYFSLVQKSHWHQSLGFFGNCMETLINQFQTNQPPLMFALWLPEIITGFVVAILCIFIALRQKPTYSSYSLSLFVFSFSAQWLLSAPRYMLPLFPIYTEYATIFKNKVADVIFTTLRVCISIFFFVIFLKTGCVY